MIIKQSNGIFRIVKREAIFIVSSRAASFVKCDSIQKQLPEITALDPNLKSHADVYNFSVSHPERFWGILSNSRLRWHQPFSQVMQCNMHSAEFKWFTGGKLNVAENCIDRHAETNPDRVALIWEKDEPGTEERITYGQLLELVNRCSNVMVAHGVSKGDCVTIYMPMCAMAVVVMLSCARIGAVHNVVFAGFSADALATRMISAKSKILVTADQAVRGGKFIELKRTADAAVAKCPDVKTVFVYQRTGKNVPMRSSDVILEKALSQADPTFTPVSMESEDPLFMLYTSGSTGQPKGIVHTQAGYLLYAALTHSLVFDYKPGDVFGCMADIGWITGHTYGVYGPLANGGTTVLFESVPTYPDPGRYWETVSRLKINQFYGAPTAIRLLLRYGEEWPQKYDLSSLRVLGSVGEPINHEAWEWYFNVVGKKRCMLVDTWWQTETGGICIAPCPGDPGAVIKPAMAMRPFYGIRPALFDEQEKGEHSYGSLCITQPWPGMARTIFGGHDRFLDTYFKRYPGNYFTGDGVHMDSDGHFSITGRMDDVINTSGHRLGTAEIEDVLDEHPSVAESAVVGFPHNIKGESIFAFVTLREGVEQSESEIIAQLKTNVRTGIASYAVPEHLLITPALVKTRSGKIMRRILRKIAAGEVKEFGDTSTLSDPSAVQTLVNQYKAKILNLN